MPARPTFSLRVQSRDMQLQESTAHFGTTSRTSLNSYDSMCMKNIRANKFKSISIAYIRFDAQTKDSLHV